jgi:membrane protein YdbS with pleckstrin-like domain
MNKKLNTLFFLLAGTVVNIVVMLLLLVGFLYLIGFLFTPETNGSVVTAVTLTAVMLSVVGSYFVYSKLVKFVNNKWNLEQWIEPLFRKKR